MDRFRCISGKLSGSPSRFVTEFGGPGGVIAKAAYFHISKLLTQDSGVVSEGL